MSSQRALLSEEARIGALLEEGLLRGEEGMSGSGARAESYSGAWLLGAWLLRPQATELHHTILPLVTLSLSVSINILLSRSRCLGIPRNRKPQA